MQSTYEVNAYHFLKRLQLKNVSLGEGLKVRLHTPYEIALEKSPTQFVFLYNFGAIIFFNFSQAEKDDLLQVLSSTFGFNLANYKYDDHQVEINPDSPTLHALDFNKITLQKFDVEMIRIFALLVGQSVALDYHQLITAQLLAETKEISEELRVRGGSNRNVKSLVKYMGACMSTKQSLTTDLYIYDEPDEAWENQKIAKLFEDVRRYLEIQSRFKSIYYDLDLIQQSSEMVADLIQIRKTHFLEITIIALIAFEVIWLLGEKLL